MQLSHSFSSLKLFENCPYRYYHQRIARTVTDKGGEASLNGERIHKQLETRLLDGSALPPELDKLEPTAQSIERMAEGGELHVEQEMTLTYQLKPTGWWDSDAWFRSKLDVCVLKGDNAVVIDWKTGKRRPDFSQLEMFALQVFQQYPNINKVSSTFVWTQTLELDKEVYNREDKSRLTKQLLEKTTRIEQALAADKWPARPSGLCKFCPCKDFCEYT